MYVKGLLEVGVWKGPENMPESSFVAEEGPFDQKTCISGTEGLTVSLGKRGSCVFGLQAAYSEKSWGSAA